MNKVFSFAKKLRLDRIVIVFMAGVLLLVTTACSSPTDTRQASRVDIPAPYSSGEGGTYNERVSGQTELYDPIQKREGGMNEYSDVDPRVNMKPVNDKARGLVENAESSIRKVQSPSDFVEEYRSGAPLGERVKNVVDRVTGATEDTVEGVSKAADRGSENLKDNLDGAGERTSDVIKQGAENASVGVQKAGEAAKDAGGTVKNVGRRAANEVRDRD